MRNIQTARLVIAVKAGDLPTVRRLVEVNGVGVNVNVTVNVYDPVSYSCWLPCSDSMREHSDVA